MPKITSLSVGLGCLVAILSLWIGSYLLLRAKYSSAPWSSKTVLVMVPFEGGVRFLELLYRPLLAVDEALCGHDVVLAFPISPNSPVY